MSLVADPEAETSGEDHDAAVGEQPDEARPAKAGPTARRPVAGQGTGGLSRLVMWAGMALAGSAIAGSYQVAAHHPDEQQARYLLLWSGIAIGLLPAVWRLFNPLVARVERVCIITAIGLLTALPKFLRNPGEPIYYDELAHWTQSEALFSSGQLFEYNGLVKVLQHYPGLHILTTSLRHLTGLTTWQVATVIVLVAHVLSLIAIFRITELLTRNSRAASLAAVAFALNPAFIVFNSQYAYQTLASPLLLWSIVALLEAVEASGRTDRRGRQLRLGWQVISVLCAVGCIFTHHLSGLILAAIMGGLTACAAITYRPRRRAPAAPRDGGGAYEYEPLFPRFATPGTLGVGPVVSGPRAPAIRTCAMVAATVVFIAVGGLEILTRGQPAEVLSYLGGNPLEGLQQLTRLGQADDTRTLFQNSGLPSWVRMCALLTPPIVAVAALWGWWSERQDARRHPLTPVFVVIGATYLASMPLVFTRDGSEGAHRLWPFSWIGLSIVVGIGVAAAERVAWRRNPRLGSPVQALLLVAVMIVAVGNVAGSANDYYLFPGKYVAGTDTRSYDAELSTLIDWFATQHPNERIAADVWTGAPIAALSEHEQPRKLAAVFPGDTALWFLYFNAKLDDRLIDNVRDDGYGYLVIDRRMATDMPFNGYWFTHQEPGAFTRTDPIPEGNLTRFMDQPWAFKVFGTDHYDVYRLDFASKDRPTSNPPVGDSSTPQTTTTTTTTTTVPEPTPVPPAESAAAPDPAVPSTGSPVPADAPTVAPAP